MHRDFQDFWLAVAVIPDENGCSCVVCDIKELELIGLTTFLKELTGLLSNVVSILALGVNNVPDEDAATDVIGDFFVDLMTCSKSKKRS